MFERLLDEGRVSGVLLRERNGGLLEGQRLEERGVVVEQLLNRGERELRVGRQPAEPGPELRHQRLALAPLRQQEELQLAAPVLLVGRLLGPRRGDRQLGVGQLQPEAVGCGGALLLLGHVVIVVVGKAVLCA